MLCSGSCMDTEATFASSSLSPRPTPLDTPPPLPSPLRRRLQIPSLSQIQIISTLHPRASRPPPSPQTSFTLFPPSSCLDFTPFPQLDPPPPPVRLHWHPFLSPPPLSTLLSLPPCMPLSLTLMLPEPHATSPPDLMVVK